MTKKFARLSSIALLGSLLILGILVQSVVAASVTPTLIPGANNDGKNCAEINSNWSQLKVESPFSGTYTDGYLTVNVVYPSTLGGSNSFDWTSNIGVDAVVVKDGNDGANIYQYDPPAESTGDTYLTTPNDGAKGISHINFCYDFELTASKTANAEFTRTYTWEITKSVDPDSHSGFAGETFSSDYDVFVDQTVVDSDFAVSGTITVNNPTPFTVNFSVSDDVDGTAATVICDTYDLDPGESTTCTYDASLGSATDGTNTATITSNTSGVGGASASASYAFGDPTTTVGDPTVNVSDSVQGSLGSASGDQHFPYSDDFDCPTNADAYTNGVYTASFPNTATIDETGDEASANVDLTCYAPVVTKDASASYDETHTWSIEKSVDPESQSGYPGDVLGWTWTVNVSETSADSNFAVSGNIDVYNPADEPMTVNVSDALNDSTVATVDCDAVADGNQTSLTVAAGDTGTCSYSATPAGKSATLNTATATINGADFTGTAAVNFVKNVIGGTATVTDVEIGLNNLLTAGSGPWEFTGSDSHTCSTNRSDYGEDGTYSNTIDNTATVTDSESNSSSDDASTTYTCSAGFVNVKKTTDGVVDPTKSINFTLYGPGLPSGGVTMNINGDADGVLEFGNALVPGSEYTICENPVPAGFTSFWMLDGNIVTPYNPNATDTPPQDLGVRCYKFTASAGQTASFEIDNSHPGGEPRTIGYWRNWNNCTGGNQSAVAAKNGGAAAGFFLVEDLLPQTIGNFNVNTCQKAVYVLSKQDQSGRNKSSDAAYELAAQLLAAKLNLAAGAETCAAVQQAVIDGQALLVSINFTGSGDYLGSKVKGALLTKRGQALALAATLDSYNNGNLCSP